MTFGYVYDENNRVLHREKGRDDVVIARCDDREKAHFLAVAARKFQDPQDVALQATHGTMVTALVKPGADIRASMTPEMADLLHAAVGVSGEAGELLDGVKKHVIYNKPLDRDNIIEELGDLEFYMEQLRQRIGVTRDETLAANIAKLSVRYEGLRYSDAAAQNRADKV